MDEKIAARAENYDQVYLAAALPGGNAEKSSGLRSQFDRTGFDRGRSFCTLLMSAFVKQLAFFLQPRHSFPSHNRYNTLDDFSVQFLLHSQSIVSLQYPLVALRAR